MNKGGFLIYKCRRCGKLLNNTHAPDGVIVVLTLLNRGNLDGLWGGMPVHLTDICFCDDRNIGVADLIGCEFDNKEK